ncbi:uncharacterized protein LAESUDRAFT_717903 [Laetiporus sulphureus 93-53]|uniref:Uncharacterized protein n=1 Tax=Laetiporus sulphureus 93-53 TaxID=1314785 RepID=A0A165BDX0_9APHY|nr:uncharacterized protein LAESUDRAFT_717903 [Laetiporus sulphureus 93-53]KZT00835.1 hypothetical protein LAESUDRAFT_717903 [Laetiporus sulphureus 93-53]
MSSKGIKCAFSGDSMEKNPLSHVDLTDEYAAKLQGIQRELAHHKLILGVLPPSSILDRFNNQDIEDAAAKSNNQDVEDSTTKFHNEGASAKPCDKCDKKRQRCPKMFIKARGQKMLINDLHMFFDHVPPILNKKNISIPKVKACEGRSTWLEAGMESDNRDVVPSRDFVRSAIALRYAIAIVKSMELLSLCINSVIKAVESGWPNGLGVSL